MRLNRSDLRRKGLLLFVLCVIGAILFAVREGHLNFTSPRAAAEPARISPVNAAPTPSPTPNPKAPADVSGMTPERFREFADHVLMGLPRRADLKRLSADEVHLTPAPLRAAAAHLGQMGDVLAQNPELKGEGFEFYRKCSLDPRGLTPVRALCLNRALRLYAELHKTLWDFDGQKLPPRVLSLAKRL